MRVETADGISLHVQVEGEGTPVVLLHGFPDRPTSGGIRSRRSSRPAIG